jgi:hypothetical protein
MVKLLIHEGYLEIPGREPKTVYTGVVTSCCKLQYQRSRPRVLSQPYDPIGISILHLIAPNLRFKPKINKITVTLNFKIKISDVRYL